MGTTLENTLSHNSQEDEQQAAHLPTRSPTEPEPELDANAAPQPASEKARGKMRRTVNVVGEDHSRARRRR